MDIDESSLPSVVLPKEEKFDFDEEVEKKYDPPRRGRTRSLTKKPADKADIKAKLERSRQSARECRARKKLRYQYLEEIISETEKAIFALRREMDMLKVWAKDMDEGKLPEHLVQYRTSCVEKKLAEPFQLQQHHHMQIQLQRQQQLSSSPASANTGLSLSPGGHITPYMAMANNQLTMLSQSLPNT